LLFDGKTGQERVVGIERLSIGDQVRVKPGERFPIDGVVVEGETFADEATLTGESELIVKHVGSTVFAGTINSQGSVLVRMTKAVADTTIERIVHMVQEAQAQKTPTQQFVESWQQPYVLAVLSASALVFIAARLIHTDDWHDAFYHAMVLLVVASPCAVVVGAPAAMLSAIARAGWNGILFKGSVHLESLGKVTTMAFDKTGTLTEGKPAVTDVWSPDGVDEGLMLCLAAAVEQRSEHPLGEPIIAEARGRRLALPSSPVEEFHSHTGEGVHGRIDGVWVGVGRERLFQSHEIAIPPAVSRRAEQIRDDGKTALLVVTSRPDVCGVIALADRPRVESASALESLKALGIRRLVMLTGDHPGVARAVSAAVHTDEFRAGLAPDEKVIELQRLASNGDLVAMVGDGVNDAPALATANVGIAMGGAGTDVALEVADVVLMSDDLRALPVAVWIARRARRRVRQNMTIAFGMIAMLVLSTFFNLPLWLGVLGHEGSTVIVVMNGLRLLWEKLPTL
jgi:Cd2+/Zn2+-exporting ATPase